MCGCARARARVREADRYYRSCGKVLRGFPTDYFDFAFITTRNCYGVYMVLSVITYHIKISIFFYYSSRELFHFAHRLQFNTLI